MLLGKFRDRANSSRLCAPGAAFDRGQPIAGRQRDVCHLHLIGEQATLCRPLLDLCRLANRFSSTVTKSHQVEVVALKSDHLGCGEGSLCGGFGGRGGQKLASLLATTIFIPYLVQIRSAHSVLERRSFQRSAIDHGFALGGVSEGETNRVLHFDSRRWLNRRVPSLEVDSVFAGSDSPFSAKLVFAAVIFREPVLVSDILCRRGSAEPSAGERFLDVLASAGERHHLLARIALEFPPSIGSGHLYCVS